MKMRWGQSLRAGCALGAVAFLAACGGSSGGGPSGTPPPPPAPSPSPTPPPPPPPPSTPTPTPPQPPPQGAVPTQFNTAEFRNSDGPDFHNAEYAWQLGFVGTGATLAVIDDGIDLDTGEFTGRLHPDSRDVHLNRSVEGEGYHGTHVAFIAAAGRNDKNIVGIAPGATILALRGELPGNCTVGNALLDAGCGIPSSSLVAGIDQAIASGARVVNISVSNSVPAEQQVADAVARAAAAGLVIVISAGNGGAGGSGASPDEPMPFARSLADAGRGNVIIVGSVGAQGSISGFSNRAGSYRDSYITALGENLCCIYYDGKLYTNSHGSRELISGTSFSAPQVAGAVALLASAFPHLTGKEIVEILLDSAFDVGAPGNDSTYGTGILDVAAAFAPKGATTIPGATTPIGLSDSFGIGSAAMGDALVGQSLQTIVIDRYRRAYELSLGGSAPPGESRSLLAAALGTNIRSLAFGNAGMAVAFTIDASNENSATVAKELRLAGEDSRLARVLAGRILLNMAPELKVAIGVADSGRALAAGLEDRDRPAFLIARSPAIASGAIFAPDFSVALRRKWRDWGVGFHAETGDIVRPGYARAPGYPVLEPSDQRTSSIGLTVDRDFGSVHFRLGVAWLREKRTILGAHFHDAFGGGGADTLFIDADAGWDFARDWWLGGATRMGRTVPTSVGFVTNSSHLVSSGWSIDLKRQSIFSSRDRLSLRIAQPLRVEAGGLALKLPVRYSYESFEPTMDIRTLTLTPSGREVVGEIAWQGPMTAGFGAASLFYRRQPDHIAARPDDMGVAIRWSSAW